MPRELDCATWRARPRMLINAEDPEDLAAAIRAADNPVIPDPALLASPQGYPARGRRLGGLEAASGQDGGIRIRIRDVCQIILHDLRTCVRGPACRGRDQRPAAALTPGPAAP